MNVEEIKKIVEKEGLLNRVPDLSSISDNMLNFVCRYVNDDPYILSLSVITDSIWLREMTFEEIFSLNLGYLDIDVYRVTEEREISERYIN